MNNPTVTVFLISLKAGGVALVRYPSYNQTDKSQNLTEASTFFIMDSWWNPSVEYQAMDRIHRLGQKRPVRVVKLVVEDSIEDQIVQLQAKKLAMTDAALSRDPDAALGKLTVEDVSGSSSWLLLTTTARFPLQALSVSLPNHVCCLGVWLDSCCQHLPSSPLYSCMPM